MTLDGTYHCQWCGWPGTEVWDQLAELLVRIPAGKTLAETIRYTCRRCGQEVWPDP